MDKFTPLLAKEFSRREEHIENILRLLDEGNTVPFIARYRKEMHGTTDDQTIRAIADRLAYLRGLDERKAAVVSAIEAQGKLTDELSAAIENAQTLAEVEDIYRPYKQKRRTRATIAREKGLAPLAELLLSQTVTSGTLEALAAAHTGEGTVLCALDARRAQVYSAAFDLATHTRLLDDDARAVTDLADFVENCKKPLFFVGDGAALCYNKYDNVPGVLCVPPALRNGRAAAVAYVAEQMAQRGEAVLPEALLPDYHRLSQAERERAERLAAEASARNNDTENGKD